MFQVRPMAIFIVEEVNERTMHVQQRGTDLYLFFSDWLCMNVQKSEFLIKFVVKLEELLEAVLVKSEQV